MSFMLGVTNELSMLNVIMLSVVAHFYYAKCQFYSYAECLYAECHYAECRYAECLYAECRGAI
jgi:hypothetical protein